MLTDSERAALVEELAEALWCFAEYEKGAAEACLPIIERLLAERDLDKMLDSVHPTAQIRDISILADGEFEAEIEYPTRIQVYDGAWLESAKTYGTGPSRTAAWTAAVKAAAREVQE